MKSVLFIEDEYRTIEDIGEKLKKNYLVDVATNGTEAVACLNKKEYDLIVLDIMMPHGKEIPDCIPAKETGIELLMRIKKEPLKMPIVVLTAVTEARSINEITKHKPEKIFYKPVNPEIFYNTLLKILKGETKTNDPKD